MYVKSEGQCKPPINVIVIQYLQDQYLELRPIATYNVEFHALKTLLDPA